MKTTHTPPRGPLFRAPLACSMSLGIVAVGSLDQAKSESVDTELVLLVDVTAPALSKNDFEALMGGYAATFNSSQILNSIQSGAYGKIAVSLMFFGNTGSQQIGIPWMMIGNSAQAQQFASSLLGLVQPSMNGTQDIGAAITAATTFFGTETGGVANGFESAVQVIEIAEANKPKAGDAAAVAASSAGALANGVDIINSLALGNQAATINAFYASNVIGTTIDGVAATSSSSDFNGALDATMNSMLTQTVQTGADTSITVVPEPGRMLALVTGIMLLMRRRHH